MRTDKTGRAGYEYLLGHHLNPYKKIKLNRMAQACQASMLRLESLLFDEDQIPYAVAQLQPAVFELGQRTVGRLWRVAFGAVLQLRLGAQQFQHLHGVVFPIGGAMQVAAWRQAVGQLLDEWRLDQTALVMARLVPGIGEEYVD